MITTNMIPSSVDCVIIGTGLTNSIIAAACARIGKSVLHVDKNNYYGGDWASFTFQQLIDWIRLNHPKNECLKEIPDELINKSKMFCLDLCPRLLFSNGSMVETLVKSNVSRYHEFKNNVRILSMIDKDLHVIPCRRSDVFTSPLLTNLVDKRRLMKFIELCVKFDPSNEECPETKEILDNSSKTIEEFLDTRGLNSTLKNYIINSIAMVESDSSAVEACESIKRFLVATERYGSSPFLFPLYGCGEFPQSFCRLSAVFGGVYCLNTNVEKVNINESKKFFVQLSNGRVESGMLVMDRSSALEAGLAKPSELEANSTRAILITTKSIVENSKNLISFLKTKDENNDSIYLLELNSSVMVCPQDINVVYLWTSAIDLSRTIDLIFDKSIIKWKCIYGYFSGVGDITTDFENFYMTSIASNDLDYTNSINQAELIFKSMYPNEEFLPKAPDPEEIISSW